MATKKRAQAASSKAFAIPVDLLKSFKKEVRFVPRELPANGWIIFDRAMLISVLRSDNVKERQALAQQIQELGNAGGELVLIENAG